MRDRVLPMGRWFTLVVLALVSMLQGCTSPQPPRAAVKRTKNAPNGRFAVISDPKTKKVEVHTVGANAELVWAFDYDVQLDDFFVSEDGQNVAIIWWPPNPVKEDGKEVALRFWNRQKGEFKTFQLGEICGSFPNVGGVERGFLSFRKPVPWAEKSRAGIGDVLHLTTVDSHECEFSLTTGELLRREWVLSDGQRFLVQVGLKLGILCFFVGCFLAFVVFIILLFAREATRPRRPRSAYLRAPRRST